MTVRKNLTDIEISDLDPEAQDAAKYDVQKAEIDWVKISEQFLSVCVKQKHNDGRIAPQFKPIEINKNELVEDAIAFIEEAIMLAYHEKYEGKDPANLRSKHKNGLFDKHKPPIPPIIPSMDSNKYGLQPNQFVEDGDLWTVVDPKDSE